MLDKLRLWLSQEDGLLRVTLSMPAGAASIFSTAITRMRADERGRIFKRSFKVNPFLTLPGNWHASTCDREEFVPTVTEFGPWAYLEFRPYSILQDFSPLRDVASLLADVSVLDLGLEIIGLVCFNVGAGDGRHYWLVECSQGKPQMAYNSLKGVQKITRELYRMLVVTGLLLVTESSKKPTLRTADLDIAAGRVPRVERQTKPIKVAGRSASNR